YRIVDGQGKPFADLWLRQSIPATSKPSGAKGVIQFPFLMESELLGVIELHGEAHDYRDQAITKGLYTLRYGHQPVNGGHAPEAHGDQERRIRRLEPSRRSVHARRSRGRCRRDAVDDSRRREELVAGGRPAQPDGPGRVEADGLSR